MTAVVAAMQRDFVRFRSVALMALDFVGWTGAVGFGAYLAVQLSDWAVNWRWLALLVVAGNVMHFLVTAQVFRSVGINRIGSFSDVANVFKAWVLVSPIMVLLNQWVLGRPIPTPAVVAALPFALGTMFAGRFVWRVAADRGRREAIDPNCQRVLVFGAGEGGEQIIWAMLAEQPTRYLPVGLLDDSPAKRNRQIRNIQVSGTRHDMRRVARAVGADLLLIAIPSADAALVSELGFLAKGAGLNVQVLPAASELIGMLQTSDIRELTDVDLLGRAEVDVDRGSIQNYITGKRVLVTGAGGSIGSELCRQLATLEPEELFMLDRDESALHGVQLSIEGKALLDSDQLIVADIRDNDRLLEIFEKTQPDVVFHTAALKHLTLLENNPGEGFKTNVVGTNNLLAAALATGVERFVNVSTDKAADPTSVLGRTKLMAERLTARAAHQSRRTYVSVRFGNVLGSRGSVLPTFRDQIEKGGPVTVTHPDVTRYFMTIPEAVRLVLQAGAIGAPAEIMILDMGDPVKIADLANHLISHSRRDIEIEFTGLRPGEKLHEVLVAASEDGHVLQHPRIFHTAGQQAGEDPEDDARLCGGLNV